MALSFSGHEPVRLPTHWRQVFYVMRQICDADPRSERPLRDTTFKNIFEEYLELYHPGWNVLYGARGVFKEPHPPGTTLVCR